MTDIVERLRRWAKFGYGVEASHDMESAADEIERLRTAMEYIVEYCEETSMSREDKIAFTLRKARAALEEKK